MCRIRLEKQPRESCIGEKLKSEIIGRVWTKKMSTCTLEKMMTECWREKNGNFQSESKSRGALSNKESPESAAEQFSPQATG